MKKIRKALGTALLTAMAVLALGSCTPKNITYFQDLNDSVVLAQTQRQAIRIEPGDKISIVVHSKDPSLSALFNLPVITNQIQTNQNYNGTGANQRAYNGNSGMSSYTVSENGTIEFPVLGTLHIAGMTRSELIGYLKGELEGRNLIKDPTVVVEFLNTGINVMGEVNRPGRYDMNRDNINVLEALALAGDMTIQGKRDNVKVIREQGDGSLKTYELDLTNARELTKSPAYYLKQNDIIYVDANGVRKRQATVNGNTALSASFWVSVASLLTSVAVLIFK